MGNVEKLKEWIELAMKNQNFTDFEFEVRGGTNKDDGYLSNITFVKVNGRKADKSKKQLDLVIKSSKQSEHFRRKAPIKQTFEKEIYIYDEVIPAFQKFQCDKGTENLVDVTPFCYSTQSTNHYEVLILRDLKPMGYKLCDRKKVMNFDHIKLVLEGYGQWHALSLALKNQEPEVFTNLIKNNVNIFSNYFVKVGLLKFVYEKFEVARKTIEDEAGEVHALKKLQFDQKAVEYIMTDMFNEDSDYSVILHGDCWTNNLLFKYDENKPVDMKIIDWQMSGVASPVFDLAFFIYACCPTEDRNVEKLLKIYHSMLGKTLQRLGSSPDEVFPYSKLMEHWKRFSSYGMVINNFVLRFSLCDADEAPDLVEAAERDQNFLDLFYFTMREEDYYLSRVKNNLLHYAHNAI